jgi:hypothetical protein
MSENPFTIEDKPSEASVSLLISKLRDDSWSKGVSPKVYAHRSRVIRQQVARLALQVSVEADQGRKRPAGVSPTAARSLDHREIGGES